MSTQPADLAEVASEAIYVMSQSRRKISTGMAVMLVFQKRDLDYGYGKEVLDLVQKVLTKHPELAEYVGWKKREQESFETLLFCRTEVSNSQSVMA